MEFDSRLYLADLVDPDVPFDKETNLFLHSFNTLLDIQPNVNTWNKYHISEPDRHWLWSLECVLKSFTTYERAQLCKLNCRPDLQRKFKNILFFQEAEDDNVVAEVVWQLKKYIGHVCVDYPFDYYITVN